MKEYEIEPRGKPPKNLRLTGRDGPPGLQMQIRGAPTWLIKSMPAQNMYEGKGRGSARGKPFQARN